MKRRDFLHASPIITAGCCGGMIIELKTPDPANAEDISSSRSSTSSVYKQAKRPTAYRVDSTIPPTLLPLSTAGKELQVLQALGRGSGTQKDAVVMDTVNLNNMLNKAVFGTIGAVSSLAGSNKDESRSGPGYASFVCLGVPAETAAVDVGLASSLLSTILQGRRNSRYDTALGLMFPGSAQPVLDAYVQGGAEDSMINSLNQVGVPEATIALYMPLLKLARSNKLDLLAIAPEFEDVRITRSQGLQAVDPERRSKYVVDPEGFVALPSDPAFQLYTDRSLFKDFVPLDAKDSGGNYFAERILVHEAAATAVAKYAALRPDSMVALLAPTSDLRFLGGINGRIPRVCKVINPDSKVTSDTVTTILLNPTAEETLSRTRYLRLEIGTGPDTLQYQTKVADYLWFSASPKVNLLTRLMEG